MKENSKEQGWQTCKLKRWGKKVGGVGVKVAFPAVFYRNVDTVGTKRFFRVQSLGREVR